MSILTVDVHEMVHTCPASNQPHTIITTRVVVSIVDNAPCRTPVTVRSGSHTARIPCRRHEPRDRQCVACKPLIIVRHTTHTDLGWQGPEHLRPDARIEVAA